MIRKGAQEVRMSAQKMERGLGGEDDKQGGAGGEAERKPIKILCFIFFLQVFSYSAWQSAVL